MVIIILPKNTMGFFFEHLGSNTFLTYRLENGEKLDTFNYGMLSNNTIENIIPAIFLQEGNDAFLRYNISSRISLNEYFIGTARKNRIIKVFADIADAATASEDYMLDENLFVLDKDYIFVDVSTGKASIILLPVAGYDNKIGFPIFFKDMLFSLKFDQTEDSAYVAEMISYINSESTFSMPEFRKFLSNTDNPANKGNQIQKTGTYISQKSKLDATVEKQVETNIDKKINVNKAMPYNNGENVVNRNDDIIANAPPKVDEKSSDIRNEIDSLKQNTKEEKITFFGLMRNFSKERLDEYKRQKSNKTDIKAQPKRQINSDFCVPGVEEFSSANQQKGEITDHKINSGYIKKEEPQKRNTHAPAKDENTYKHFNFGKTECWDDSVFNKTIPIEMLDSQNLSVQEKDLKPFLIRKSTGEQVYIDKSPFKIGKEKSFVDYAVNGNIAISGCHAFIYEENGEYLIKDTNSTNHVYINGKQIENNELISIHHQDIIRLANEDFEFRKH